MSLIIPANSITGGFAVDNSLRFDDGSSDYLNRTPGSASNRKTFTFSTWVKRSALGGNKALFSAQAWPTTPWFQIQFEDNKLKVGVYDTTYEILLVTTPVYRDVSAWYHVVVAVDTTQATSSNRVKLYVNAVQVTSFDNEIYPSLNFDTAVNNTVAHYIGDHPVLGYYYDGYMSETVLIDGSQLTPTDFGEFDEDSGIWKPIDVSGLTFGTNGFYLDFEDSAALGDDVSGNGNDFTVNNLTAIDQTTDTPTNNFATGNILSPYANRTITDGSLTITSTTTQWTNICSTIGVSSGKWWIELKHTAGSYGGLGIVSPFPQTENNVIGDFSAPVIQQIGYIAASGDKKINNSTSSYGSTWVGTGDIVNMSLNLDDNELKFYKNGTVQNSGTAIAISSGYTYFVGTSNYNSSGSSFNFGNPAFSISSGNADANGYGNFEYAPPAGFLALCTANLSEVLG
jgi:hypothetical protein